MLIPPSKGHGRLTFVLSLAVRLFPYGPPVYGSVWVVSQVEDRAPFHKLSGDLFRRNAPTLFYVVVSWGDTLRRAHLESLLQESLRLSIYRVLVMGVPV